MVSGNGRVTALSHVPSTALNARLPTWSQQRSPYGRRCPAPERGNYAVVRSGSSRALLILDVVGDRRVCFLYDVRQNELFLLSVSLQNKDTFIKGSVFQCALSIDPSTDTRTLEIYAAMRYAGVDMTDTSPEVQSLTCNTLASRVQVVGPAQPHVRIAAAKFYNAREMADLLNIQEGLRVADMVLGGCIRSDPSSSASIGTILKL